LIPALVPLSSGAGKLVQATAMVSKTNGVRVSLAGGCSILFPNGSVH